MMDSSSATNSKITSSSQPPSKPSWVLRSQNQEPLEHPQLRLLCIPHAGSGAFVYHSWNGHLPDGVEVLPIEVPGRNSRRKEPPPTSISQFAKDFIDALGPDYLSENSTVPYVLFGHSLGAWMAYAIVQELQERHFLINSDGNGDLKFKKYKFPSALIVSGTRSPKLAGREHDPDGVEMYTLDGPRFWEIFEKRYGKNPGLSEPDVREFFRPKLQADFKLGETYRPPENMMNVPLPCPLYVFCGLEDPRCVKESVQAWQDCVSGADNTFQVKYFSGGHHYLLNEEESKNEFLNYLSEHVLKNTTDLGKQKNSILGNDRSGSGAIEEALSSHQTTDVGGGISGGGLVSAWSMSSDAGATVASGSSYAALGVGGTTRQQKLAGIGAANNGSMARSKGNLIEDARSERDELEGHDDDGGDCGNWKMTCCCF